MPTTLPAIVQKRLREARVKEEKPKPKTPTVGAATVAKIGGRLSIFYSGELQNSGRSLTSFKDGQAYEILYATDSTDDRFTNRDLHRSEVKTLNIPQGSDTGSYAVLAAKTGRLASPEIHRVTAERPALGSEESRQPNGPEQTFQPGVGLWGGGEYENIHRDATAFEDGYDSDIWRVTVGADYQFTDRILAGLAFDYYRHDGDYDGGGGFDNDSYGFLGFGVFRPFDRTFFQVTAGYARKEYDRERSASFVETHASSGLVNYDTSVAFGTTKVDADYDASESRINALAAYTSDIGNLTLSPRIGVDYCYLDLDSYSEKGRTGLELTFYDDVQKWLQSRVGAQASMAWSTDSGLIIPHASVDWVHEFENDQRDVEVSFVDDTRGQRFSYNTEKPDRDFFEFNAGIAMTLPNGFQILGNYRTIVGHSFFDSRAGTIRLRYAF